MDKEPIKKYAVKHYGGNYANQILIHYDGPFQPADLALCGADLMGDGDERGGWESGIETNKKVNCQACLMIIEAVKKIIRQDK